MSIFLSKNSILFIIYVSLATIGSISDSKIQKKIIRNGGYDIECYVSLKKIRHVNTLKTYYWFRSGQVHQSLSSYGGQLLHSNYVKYFRSNQLAEKGIFNYGLKNGKWKKWYKNGRLKHVEEWKNGFRNGLFITFDSIGNRIKKGYYKADKKSGYWINFIDKDTILYEKGVLKIVDTNKNKRFLNRLFKSKDSLKSKNSLKFFKNSKKGKNQPKITTKKKEGFFKRLLKNKK